MPLYFAYGSNMSQSDLDAWCKKNQVAPISLESCSPKVAILRNYDLVFNYYSCTREGGAANIEPRHGASVEGLLLEVTDPQLRIFDRKEGAPNDYKQIDVEVIIPDGSVISGVKTYTVVEDKKAEGEDVWPSAKYIGLVIGGALRWGLSEEWIKRLQAIPFVEETESCD